MNDSNMQTHQTVFGGFITVLVSVSFFSFFMQSMIRYDEFYKKDTVSTTSQRFDHTKPQPAEILFDIETNSNRFDMMFYVNNDTFNNFDNPYGFFKFHMYTNMEDQFDTEGKLPGHNDIEIPVAPCDQGTDNS